MTVTARQIQDATGIRTSKTLKRWTQSGYLPKPISGLHPDKGIGRTTYWKDDSILPLCIEVVRLRHSGYSIQEAFEIANQTETKTPNPDIVCLAARIRKLKEELDSIDRLVSCILKGKV